MSDERIIQYGDRKMPLEAGMTLEQAKELMARHFPELSNPKVEKKEVGGKTIYVFSKQAGHKGSGQMDQVLAEIAQHCLAQPIIAPHTLRAVETMSIDFAVGMAHDDIRLLREEADAARVTANALLDAPAAITLNGAVL